MLRGPFGNRTSCVTVYWCDDFNNYDCMYLKHLIYAKCDVSLLTTAVCTVYSLVELKRLKRGSVVFDQCLLVVAAHIACLALLQSRMWSHK